MPAFLLLIHGSSIPELLARWKSITSLNHRFYGFEPSGIIKEMGLSMLTESLGAHG